MPSHYYKKRKRKKGWLKVWTDERHTGGHEPQKTDRPPRDPVYIPVKPNTKRRPYRPPIRIPRGNRLGRPTDNLNPFAPTNTGWFNTFNNALSGMGIGAAASILGAGKYILPFI